MYQAMVVSDAYDGRADWAEAIFNNVVINGDMRYLQEMRLHVHITSVLVEDVVKRYGLQVSLTYYRVNALDYFY